MSTLIIHPKDHTTDFLKPIYAPIKNKTVIWGGIRKTQLRKLIEINDRIIMLGHGSPWGLLSMGQFPMAGNYIIDYSMIDLLSQKTQNIFIWCHADQFVQRHNLQGFSSGMFISELAEASFYGLNYVDGNMINESNERFSSIVAQHIKQPLDDFHKNVLQEFNELSKTNPIARFNQERLYLNVNNKKNGSNLSKLSIRY